MFDVRDLAVELQLVANSMVNLESPTDMPEPATDGPDTLGIDPNDLTADMVNGVVRRIYLQGVALTNVCTNRIPVEITTSHGRRMMSLTFKAAAANGKRTARRWFSKAVGPLTDDHGKAIGLSQAGRTRLRADLKRGVISRREATFLGIQSSLVVTSKFEVLKTEGWRKFRQKLFQDCYECSNISAFGKQWKKFTTAIQNSLLHNELLVRPREQLENIVQSFPTAKRVADILLRTGIPILTGPRGSRDRMWVVAHLTQSRFLPGPSRKECLSSVVELKDRLTGPRLTGAQWEPDERRYQSAETACHAVGMESRDSRHAKAVTQSHLSLSNSACLEYTRKEGGKLAILWGTFNDFLHTAVADLFDVSIKPDSELDYLEETLMIAETRVEVESPEPSIPHNGELYSPRYVFTKGLPDVEPPLLPEVFTDISLEEFLPSGFQMSNYAEAYQLAMTTLRFKIERRKRDRTGIYDIIGNEVCPIQHSTLPVWQIAYLTDPIDATQFNQPLPLETEDGETILDLRAGVDSRFGMLLFLWSEIEFRKWKAAGSQPLPVDPVPISEPGVKARIATKSLIWINLFLSPASHFIKDTMLSIPGCRTGLKGSDHAWNFEASFGRHASSWREIEAISTSDLTAATDWLEHDVASRAMKAFLAGRFTEHPATSYFDDAIDLVCSPRLLLKQPSCFRLKSGIRNKSVYKKYLSGPAPMEVSHSGKSYEGFKTQRAVLMGEPLTKMILSLLSIAAERAARASESSLQPSLTDYRKSRTRLHQYACAGDDHIGLGRISYLSQIPRFLEFWSGEISWDKYCISRYGAHYCQDFIIKPQPGRRYALRPLSKLARDGSQVDGPKYKLDHVWLRLFSDRRKVGSAVFEETNPFPGKSKALTESMGWAKWDLTFCVNLILLQKLGLGRWFPASYLKDVRSYVPQAFGGRGLLALPGIELTLPESLRYCILESDQPAVRTANGSGDSRKLRGVILDDSDKALARLQQLNVKVFNYEEVELDASREEIDSFGDMSRTSLQSRINLDFVDYQKFDLTEKKLAAITKAIKGPSVLKERQKSYEGRIRSVVRAQQKVFERNCVNLSPLPLVRAKILQPWAAIDRLYVRRSDLEALLPRGVLPSFTIPIQNLSGSMSLIEMESRVLPQRGENTDSLDRTESASMSEIHSLDDTSLSSYTS